MEFSVTLTKKRLYVSVLISILLLGAFLVKGFGGTNPVILGHDSSEIEENDPTVTASVKDGVDWTEILSSVPAAFQNGDDSGIASESDPTVTASVKDGVDWSEVTSKPAGFSDNIDNVGTFSCTVRSGGGNPCTATCLTGERPAQAACNCGSSDIQGTIGTATTVFGVSCTCTPSTSCTAKIMCCIYT